MNTGMKTSATMNKKRFSEIISLVWLIICFAAACYYVARYNTLFIDADMSSELVLAKLLSEEGGILSKSWYYSTELRILNTQLIFAPLFAVIDDWSLVRAIGTAICLFIYILCYFFFARSIHLGRSHMLFSAGILMLPLSSSYTYSVLTGAFYIPHICLAFILFGLILRYAECDGSKRVALLIFASLISFIAGLGGIRQLYVFSAPLTLAAAIVYMQKKKADDERAGKRLLSASIITLIVSGVACLINRGLHNIYSFCNYGETGGRMPVGFTSFSGDGIDFCIDGLMELMGYHTGPAFSGFLVYNILFGIIFVGLLISMIYALKHDAPYTQKAMVWFIFAGVGMQCVLYCFTSIDRVARYFIPVVIFAVPFAALFFEKSKLDRRLRVLGVTGLAALMAVCSAYTYKTACESSAYSANQEYIQLVDYIKQEGYEQGYASFWNGNILTELSDGEIEMWVVSSDMITDKLGLKYVYNWLQVKAHDNTTPQEPFFLIMKDFEARACGMEMTPSFCTDTLILYHFDSIEDFQALYN